MIDEINAIIEAINAQTGCYMAGLISLAIITIVQGIRINILTDKIDAMMKHLGIEED